MGRVLADSNVLFQVIWTEDLLDGWERVIGPVGLASASWPWKVTDRCKVRPVAGSVPAATRIPHAGAPLSFGS